MSLLFFSTAFIYVLIKNKMISIKFNSLLFHQSQEFSEVIFSRAEKNVGTGCLEMHRNPYFYKPLTEVFLLIHAHLCSTQGPYIFNLSQLKRNHRTSKQPVMNWAFSWHFLLLFSCLFWRWSSVYNAMTFLLYFTE